MFLATYGKDYGRWDNEILLSYKMTFFISDRINETADDFVKWNKGSITLIS